MDLKQFAEKNQNDIVNNQGNGNINDVSSLAKAERQAIINAMNFTKHNKRKSAKILGISERTLYRKLQDYGID